VTDIGNPAPRARALARGGFSDGLYLGFNLARKFFWAKSRRQNMNRLAAFILGLSVLAVGCDGSSPDEPSQGATTTTTFTAPLSAANEVPRIANADASASGTATIALTVTKDDSGGITAATMNFQVSVAGFPAGTTVTKAHVHKGAAGVNGDIFVDAALASGELALTNGSGSIAKNGINVPADRAAAILSNPTGHYFNVHTAINPDGAIRGQFLGGATSIGPGTPY
jgi:CHRD domain-containing protein